MGETGEAAVLILMGSPSDLPKVQVADQTLKELGIWCEMHVASAHRTPERVAEIAREARGRGVKVIIAAAGAAAHLAGAVAANTTLPVIGIPIASGALNGLDALLATVQMPPGVPVGTLGVGSWGARNAAHLAIRILALGDAALGRRLEAKAAGAMAPAAKKAGGKGKR